MLAHTHAHTLPCNLWLYHAPLGNPVFKVARETEIGKLPHFSKPPALLPFRSFLPKPPPHTHTPSILRVQSHAQIVLPITLEQS